MIDSRNSARDNQSRSLKRSEKMKSDNFHDPGLKGQLSSRASWICPPGISRSPTSCIPILRPAQRKLKDTHITLHCTEVSRTTGIGRWCPKKDREHGLLRVYECPLPPGDTEDLGYISKEAPTQQGHGLGGLLVCRQPWDALLMPRIKQVTSRNHGVNKQDLFTPQRLLGMLPKGTPPQSANSPHISEQVHGQTDYATFTFTENVMSILNLSAWLHHTEENWNVLFLTWYLFHLLFPHSSVYQIQGFTPAREIYHHCATFPAHHFLISLCTKCPWLLWMIINVVIFEYNIELFIKFLLITITGVHAKILTYCLESKQILRIK